MTSILSSEEELRKALTLFMGQTCWNVRSCDNGYALHLYFGKAVEGVISIPTITEINPSARYFTGQYELAFVCSWRLDDENHNPFLSGGWSDYHEIKTTAISLVGETIESIEIIPPVWEASVRFSSGKQLRAFCDSVPSSSDTTTWMNWWCETEEYAYIIGPGKKIRKSERRPRLVSNTLYDPEELVDPDFIIFSDKDYVPEEMEEKEPDD